MTDTFYGSDFDALCGARPRHRGDPALRARPAARRPAAHRERELLEPGGADRARLDVVEQVRRGLPGAPLLRRLQRGRQGRDAGDRAVQDPVRRRPRERAGALGRERQPGRLRRVPQARREDPRDEPAARGAPHPRHQGVLQRQVVRRRALRGRQGHRGHRLRRGRAAGEGAPSQGHPRRGLGDPAAHRLRAVPGRRGRGRRDLLGRRRPLHRPRRGWGHPEPGAPRRRRVVHDPQGAARPALGRHRLPGRARDRHRQGRVPDDAGRPADALRSPPRP